jgi:hypothetical protein
MPHALSIAAAQREAGSISIRNSKMPSTTFALTVDQCNVGAKLALIPGSTCHECYAADIEKRYPSAHKGWTTNFERATQMISSDPERWSKWIAFQIVKLTEKTTIPYHRWFDSGDIASLAMLHAIVRVCELTPDIHHWLPTREAAVVKAFLRQRDFPPNLVVRISSTMVDDKPIKGYNHTSTVHSKDKGWIGEDCQARTRGNACGPCRTCWDPTVANVSYPLH